MVKADGLALGKGVIICHTRDEAEQAVRDMMERGKFGAAGNRVVVEEFLQGPEVSVLAFTDGVSLKWMAPGMSVGLCDIREAESPEQMLQIADQRMYEQKKTKA